MKVEQLPAALAPTGRLNLSDAVHDDGLFANSCPCSSSGGVPACSDILAPSTYVRPSLRRAKSSVSAVIGASGLCSSTRTPISRCIATKCAHRRNLARGAHVGACCVR